MSTDKILTDAGTTGIITGAVIWWHYAETVIGGLMLLGGLALLVFRFYIANKENKLLNIQIENAQKEQE